MKLLKRILTLGFLILPSLAMALVGGHPGLQNGFPSTVKLGYFFGANCSAVKIGPTTYLTAAHCFNKYDQDTEFKIYDERLLSTSINQSPVKAVSVHLHPSWRTKISKKASAEEMAGAANSGEVLDLAIYEVEGETPEPIAKISFDKVDVENNETVIIGGYGDNESGPDPKMTAYNVVATLGGKGSTFRLLPQTLDKIETEAPRIWLRAGDSGGPVYWANEKFEVFVVGINSGSAGYGTAYETGVAARLDIAKDWIKKFAKFPTSAKK